MSKGHKKDGFLDFDSFGKQKGFHSDKTSQFNWPVFLIAFGSLLIGILIGALIILYYKKQAKSNANIAPENSVARMEIPH